MCFVLLQSCTKPRDVDRGGAYHSLCNVAFGDGASTARNSFVHMQHFFDLDPSARQPRYRAPRRVDTNAPELRLLTDSRIVAEEAPPPDSAPPLEPAQAGSACPADMSAAPLGEPPPPIGEVATSRPAVRPDGVIWDNETTHIVYGQL